VPLAKPLVLVALVALAVAVWVMVGVPAVSRFQVSWHGGGSIGKGEATQAGW
jgi:hypothetical protein